MSSIIINIDTALTDVPIIEIGKQGENEATQVVFDVSDMIDTFGSGTAYVVVQRRGDAEPYLLDNTQQSSDKVTWTVSNVDTDVYGMGRVQLFWMIGDQVAKSVNYQFYVEEALGNPTDAPVVPGGWISEKIGDLDELTTTAKENLVAAINEVNALVDEVADDVEGLTTDVETLQEQMETKANVDGLYEDMTVGNAEQLIASDYATDKAPYLFRKTGGSTDVGNREYDTLVGASAVWNQLVQNGNFESTNNWSVGSGDTFTVENNTATFRASARYRNVTQSINNGLSGHVYLGLITAQSYIGTGTKLSVRRNTGGSVGDAAATPINTTKTRLGVLSKFTQNGYLQFLVQDDNASGWGDIIIENAQVVDLTTFFGSSTIPDYVYSLERSTAGSGVAWLRQYFPTLFEYHQYDAGTLKSVEGVEIHDMVGFNQWDEEWELGGYNDSGEKSNHSARIRCKNKIPVFPSTTYCFSYLDVVGNSVAHAVLYYDADENYISTEALGTNRVVTFTTPSNCHYLTFYVGASATPVTTYNHDICINLSNSGYRNGEYEPYWKRSYPLDSTWVGRGIYKLGSDGKPYADGDIYASDGTVTVNYTKRAYQSGDESLANAITDGTNTVVKLSTPTTTTLTPFQSPQICDDFGTEEYVTDCLIPVGHETKYPANLRDKVQHLPDLSNLGNGNYIINQTGMQMSLIPTTSIIPALPTTDGTYNLKCTVSGGQPTLTWEVDS